MFFAGEFVGVSAGGQDGPFSAEGVEIGVVENGASSVGNDAGSAEAIGKVVVNVVQVVAAGDARAVKENVLVEGGVVSVPGEVSFVE